MGDPIVGPVYLAARYSRRDELCGYARRLSAVGVQVSARWLDGEHASDFDRSTSRGVEGMARFAAEDMDDVMGAATVIAFTEEPRKTNTRGGRHVEFGAVLARQRLAQWKRPRLIVVGPVENVFHALADLIVPDFDALVPGGGDPNERF